MSQQDSKNVCLTECQVIFALDHLLLGIRSNDLELYALVKKLSTFALDVEEDESFIGERTVTFKIKQSLGEKIVKE